MLYKYKLTTDEWHHHLHHVTLSTWHSIKVHAINTFWIRIHFSYIVIWLKILIIWFATNGKCLENCITFASSYSIPLPFAYNKIVSLLEGKLKNIFFSPFLWLTRWRRLFHTSTLLPVESSIFITFLFSIKLLNCIPTPSIYKNIWEKII